MKLNTDASNLGFNPLIKWAVCFFTMTVLFLLIGYPHFANAILNDDSGITWAIIFLLFLGLIGTCVQAFRLKEDYKFLKYHLQHFFQASDVKKKTPRGFGNSPLVQLLSRCKASIEQQLELDINGIAQSYYTRTNSSNRLLITLSTLLVTLGLIGTIVGLIYAVGGLNEVIHHVGASKDDLMAGLGKTIRGMGTAFYTTFLGALSGGIMLKVLCVNNTTSLSIMASCLRDFLELDLMPYLAHQRLTGETPGHKNLNDTYEELKNTLQERMQKDMDVLKMQFQHYHESMETIESDLKTFQDLFAFMKSQDWSQRLNEFSKGMSHLKENSPEQKPKASSIKPEPEQRPKRKINPKTKRGENS
jgi:biopolymer transport protein ExbB/TolQ